MHFICYHYIKGDCDSGYEERNGQCVECAQGFYRDKSQGLACVACPAGFTTTGVGSTSQGQCTLREYIIWCDIQTYVGGWLVWRVPLGSLRPAQGRPVRGSAHFVSIRYDSTLYRDKSQGLVCVLCPTGLTTTGVGSTSQGQCTLRKYI